MDPMFTTKNVVRLSDTDAAGIFFYPRLFEWAQAALEDFMALRGLPISYILGDAPYFFPIVHAESDYLSPLKIGDEVAATLRVESVGESSFTLSYTFIKGETIAAKAKIVHVTVDKSTFKKRPLPKELKLDHLPAP